VRSHRRGVEIIWVHREDCGGTPRSRHGFEEIDGPTFEYLELYTAKSGEGIVSEIFGVFSGKDEGELAAIRAGGAAPYALRPEFTPTLARMYAAKAGSLPKPCKWFWQQNCFRAERPQRGRLREFGQWNCDVIGDGSPEADAETIAASLGLMSVMGLRPSDVRVRYNHRRVLSTLLSRLGVDEEHMGSAFVLLDRREKLENDALEAMAFEFGITGGDFIAFLKRPRGRATLEELLSFVPGGGSGLDMIAMLRAMEARSARWARRTGAMWTSMSCAGWRTTRGWSSSCTKRAARSGRLQAAGATTT
jgi:ATP phosphoribosyltransferase regulatory subunit HisZ